MATPSKRSSVTRSQRRPSSSGPPTIVLVGGLLLAIAAGAFAFMSGVNSTSNADVMIYAAESAFSEGMGSTDVNKKLAMAESDPSLTAEQSIQIARLRERLKVRDVETTKIAHNTIGTVFLQKKLKKYSDKHLSGSPDKPKARVFLQRARAFRERWPEHPELDWVSRQETRFADFVKLSDPPSFADVRWEAETLTYSKPRDYSLAFDALDGFIAGASSDDATLARNYRETLESARNEYHADRMLEAKSQFEDQNNEAGAVTWLVWSAIGIGDEAMSNEAAEFLVKLPSVDAFLRGYRTRQPLVHERILQHPILKAHWDSMQ